MSNQHLQYPDNQVVAIPVLLDSQEVGYILSICERVSINGYTGVAIYELAGMEVLTQARFIQMQHALNVPIYTPFLCERRVS